MTTQGAETATVVVDWLLRLYVARPTAVTTEAVESLRRACEQVCTGACRVEVVDVREQPQLAETDKILATPTLVRIQPPPTRRLVGDLSNMREVLTELDLPSAPPDSDAQGEGQ